MANIKFKKWVLNDDFCVQDMIDLAEAQSEPAKAFKVGINLLESHRTEGPKITTKLSLKDFKKLQEKINQAFL